MGDVATVAWYATTFRGDAFEAALGEIAPVALRYGATEYEILRSDDDRYSFLQLSTFSDHSDWERYWYGAEFSAWRANHQGWFQVPSVYTFHTRVARTALEPELTST